MFHDAKNMPSFSPILGISTPAPRETTQSAVLKETSISAYLAFRHSDGHPLKIGRQLKLPTKIRFAINMQQLEKKDEEDLCFFSGDLV